MHDAKWRGLALAVGLLLLVPASSHAGLKAGRRTLPRGAASQAAAVPGAQAEDPQVQAAVQRLRTARRQNSSGGAPSGESAREPLIRTPDGYVRALATSPDQPFIVARPGADRSPAGLALSFLTENRVAFGWSKPGAELRRGAVRARTGRTFVRFEQRFGGLRVFGAGAVVQVEPSGGIPFVLSHLARDSSSFYSPGFTTQPTVAAGAAEAAAHLALPKERRASDLAPESAPELMVFEPSVIGAAGPAQLVWYVRLRSEQALVDEVVLVNALTGAVTFHYSNVREAKNRQVYDAANVSGSLGSLARSEGESAVGTPPDVDLAYDALGATYDFYFSHFGRDSFDGAGATLIGRVRYCPAGYACPYDNAYWSGVDMRFGDGYAAADDVVAHELTHAVTEHESNLIYWGESGAIDEALSDIFGEFVDQTDGQGNDSAGVKWEIGEDLPGGAIRNMADPTLAPFYQPDRRYSSYWYIGDGDNRGVHINSGVANKLAFLLTDGATFNGETISPLGINAVASLFYEAQVDLLVPASDYFDLFAALRQAALNLSWSQADRDDLDAACRAVEIAVPSYQQTILSDGFEGSFPGNWEVFDASGARTTWGRSTVRHTSGTHSVYCAAGGLAPAPPGGPYKPNMETWMIYGPFSLSDAEDAWADFDLYVDVDPFSVYDDVWFGVSIDSDWSDGQDWDGFYVQPLPDGLTPGWVHQNVNFKEMSYWGQPVGEPKVWFAIVFDSDATCPGGGGCAYSPEPEGVYVDSFEIKKAKTSAVTVTAPNGGQSWPVGSRQRLTWTAQNLDSSDSIKLSLVDGATVTEIATVPYDQTSYLWTVGGATTSTARIRAECVGCYPAGSDDSDADFSITPAVIPGAAPGDFNGDGKSDIVWQNKNGALGVWYMDGATQIGGASLSPAKVATSWRLAAVADVNRDGKPDILWQNTNGSLAVWYMDGANQIGGALLNPAKVSTTWRLAAAADFNGDGKPDILWQNTNGSLAVWYMDGANQTGGELLNPGAVSPTWKLAAAGDFTHDGKPDILWQNTNGSLAIWYMDGVNQTYGELLNPSRVGTVWRLAALADLDGDAKPEILWQNKNGSLAVWYMDGATETGGGFLTPSRVGTTWALVGPK
jgi:hypothetical protein